MRLFLSRAAALSIVLFAVLAPYAAYAAAIGDSSFIPIVPVPGVTDSSNALTFPQYVNQIFKLSVSAGAMLAVLMFVLGGFEYMTGTKAGDKKSGLDRIQGAITGLVLLLSVYLILYVINPCILNITVLSDGTSPCSPVEQVWTPSVGTDATDTTNGTQTTDGIQTTSIPSGACLRDTAFSCGGVTTAAHVCVVENGTRYYDAPNGAPQGASICITGSEKYMCAAGCPGAGSTGYPYSLSGGYIGETSTISCASNETPIPVCVSTSDPFTGTQPSGTSCSGGATLKYFCPSGRAQ
jgi:hypothetical protein